MKFPMFPNPKPIFIFVYIIYSRLDAYTSKHIVYTWDNSNDSVSFEPGMALSQFDLISHPYRNLSIRRKEGKQICRNTNTNAHHGFHLEN